MRPILYFFWIMLVAVVIFALYYVSMRRVFTEREALQTFVTSFDPLSAFFTALAFFGLVFGLWYQARELEATKTKLRDERNERIETLIQVIRLQTAGLRLISLSIEKDANSSKARQELEAMVDQFEGRLHKEITGEI